MAEAVADLQHCLACPELAATVLQGSARLRIIHSDIHIQP